MTFPAREQFDREHGDALARLYAYCRGVLGFYGPKEIKAFPAARYAKIGRQNVSRTLDRLVCEGFLIEHEREGPKRPRRFTLAFEVNRPAVDGSGVRHRKSA